MLLYPDRDIFSGSSSMQLTHLMTAISYVICRSITNPSTASAAEIVLIKRVKKTRNERYQYLWGKCVCFLSPDYRFCYTVVSSVTSSVVLMLGVGTALSLATALWAGRCRTRTPMGARDFIFSVPIQIAPGPTRLAVLWVSGFFIGRKVARARCWPPNPIQHRG